MEAGAHTHEIAVTTLDDGRLFLADHDLQAAGPEAMRFVERYHGFWERDHLRGGWVSGPVDRTTQQLIDIF